MERALVWFLLTKNKQPASRLPPNREQMNREGKLQDYKGFRKSKLKNQDWPEKHQCVTKLNGGKNEQTQ